MAASSLSMSCAPTLLHNKMRIFSMTSFGSSSCNNTVSCCSLPDQCKSILQGCYHRRLLLTAPGMLALSCIPLETALAQDGPQKYKTFVDKADGYSYVYPSDWRDFDFRAHDSAFKDRYLQLQNVRLSFLPTDKNDIHDLGPMETVVRDIVQDIIAAPNQAVSFKEIQERSANGKNYYTVEYQLTTSSFAVSHFTTFAIANGRFYNLTVGANERRWKRFRNRLKVVADSFEVFDI